jgi:hypothetical protein
MDVNSVVDVSEVNTTSSFKVDPEYGESNTAHTLKIQ